VSIEEIADNVVGEYPAGVQTADGGTGSARKKRSQRYIRTAGGSEASAESACCASVASESNEASPTCTKPKSCEEPHLRRHDNIIKRLLIHAGAFNLGLVMRKISGCGTPRGFQGDLNAFLIFIPLLWKVSVNAIPRQWPLSEPHEVTSLQNATPFRMPVLCLHPGTPFLKISSATGC